MIEEATYSGVAAVACLLSKTRGISLLLLSALVKQYQPQASQLDGLLLLGLLEVLAASKLGFNIATVVEMGNPG